MKVDEILAALTAMFPDAHCELNHRNPFELAVAVVLSAQTTDVSVNKVTPRLFEKYPTPQALAEAPLEDIEDCIRRIGLYHNKAKSIQGLARGVVEQFGGVMPQTMEELTSLPGSWPQERQRHYVGVLRNASDRGRYACGTRFQAAGAGRTEGYRAGGGKETDAQAAKSGMVARAPSVYFLRPLFLQGQNPQCQDCPFTSFCREYKAQQKPG